MQIGFEQRAQIPEDGDPELITPDLSIIGTETRLGTSGPTAHQARSHAAIALHMVESVRRRRRCARSPPRASRAMRIGLAPAPGVQRSAEIYPSQM